MTLSSNPSFRSTSSFSSRSRTPNASGFADRIGQTHFTGSSRLDRRWNDVDVVFAEDVRPLVVPSAVDPAAGAADADEFLRIKAKLFVDILSNVGTR
jgi:hypothetical protein